MEDNVFNYLHDYGFSAIDLDKILERNDAMFDTNLNEVRKNITFLEEKYLEPDDIIDLVNKNPFMLTEKNQRLEALGDIYDYYLGFSYDQIKALLKANPDTYSENPIELGKIINYLKEQKWNVDAIRQLLLKTPSLLDMNFEDFKNVIMNNQNG